jgi:hypothetical protein
MSLQVGFFGKLTLGLSWQAMGCVWRLALTPGAVEGGEESRSEQKKEMVIQSLDLYPTGNS